MSVPAPPSAGGSLTPRSAGAVEVATARPRTRVEVKRTRRWMLLMLLTPVVIIVVVWLDFDSSVFRLPVVPPVATPKGYTAITDAYYGYSVPATYEQNPSWTDADGDFFYGTTAGGWVAETMLVTKHSPTAATKPPSSFALFGEPTPTPYRVSGGHRVRVDDTTFAYEETITRPDGWRAVAVDTWLGDSSTQMWLLVKAPPGVTRTVIASLRGSS
jgi:hypothetical protein